MNHTTTTDTQITAKHGNNSKLVYAKKREAENLDEITQIFAEMDVSPLTARVNRTARRSDCVIGRIRKRFCSVLPLL